MSVRKLIDKLLKFLGDHYPDTGGLLKYTGGWAVRALIAYPPIASATASIVKIKTMHSVWKDRKIASVIPNNLDSTLLNYRLNSLT